MKQPKKSVHTFQVIVEQDEAGWYVAECPALKACYTQGKTYEEAIENIKDVIEMCSRNSRRRANLYQLKRRSSASGGLR